MRNPVNRLATAAPRALDSLLSGKNTANEQTQTQPTSSTAAAGGPNKKKSKTTTEEHPHPRRSHQERSLSFDIIMGIDMIGSGDGGSCGNSHEGSVVTFEDLSSDFHLMDSAASVNSEWGVGVGGGGASGDFVIGAN
mmetsp:Transcript_17346/g.34647  ORF Transcript_17346/g.34647 Transcript_17346/m.34647 type:complete len:137 (-) Transcript_17346:641-1051(-)